MADDYTDITFSTPARVIAGSVSAEELTRLIAQNHALDKEILDSNPPFFWTAEISSSRVDTYFTNMSATTTLPNFATEAAAGVSFQDSHKTCELGFGRSLTGRLIGSNGNGVTRVTADFYTIPGLQLNGVTTNNLILGMRSGLVKDVSVGFYGGQFICAICNKDMLRDWGCEHIPGLEYSRRDDSGQTMLLQTATATVENAHLAEVSAVFDGSTPGASILKAQQQARAGNLSDPQIRLLESRYRMRLPEPVRQVVGVTFEQEQAQQELPMAEPIIEPVAQDDPVVEPVETDATPTAEALALGEVEAAINAVAEATDPVAPAARFAAIVTRLQSSVTTATERAQQVEADLNQRLVTTQTDLAGVRDQLLTAQAELVTERATVASLSAEAADGRTYREDLIKATLSEGVRAFGAGFSADTYEPVLKTAGLDVIKRMQADWRGVADKIFTAGRQIDETTVSKTSSRTDAPNAAYTG